LFFPAAARPALSFRFLVHIPTRSRLVPGLGRTICVCVRRPLYILTRPCNRLPLRVSRVSYLDPRGNTGPRRPRATPGLPAHHDTPRRRDSDTLTRATLPAAPPPALRAIPHGSLDTPVMLRPSPHSFSPSGWPPGSGECSIAASESAAASRPGDPATDPHSGSLRHERLRRNQCPARLFGSSAECTFPSPPFKFRFSLRLAGCSLCFSALPAIGAVLSFIRLDHECSLGLIRQLILLD
jgi:hypothetical protein